MVQAVTKKNGLVFLIKKIVNDIGKLVCSDKVRVSKVPLPIQNGLSVDVFVQNTSHLNGECWYSLFFTVSLPIIEKAKEAVILDGMFLSDSIKQYTVVKIMLFLPGIDPQETEKLPLNASLRKLVQQNQNVYVNF